ncbi:N-acyl-aliphatic-L-amino acid amidohydrolase [Synchytrium microbalum]|uniref:N-acyl-aliphatic-L-amino acid amidohydrolase n=1 Tax=Synchytrium microbalum TaxID=1806994 RepID=A0A507C9F4_9FUNG|nr:N-acyl-aliphatic-L-amino acid amidohydrolase [Synchytrium microbalum]TPX37707.1 N-acyl-aliphatic-L-amino acid amidohydrolase [Synchytrium microbalum]
MQPAPDYAAAKAFLHDQAQDIGLDFQSLDCVKGKPICILTWIGKDPSLPTIMLNSHIDVVPVFPESWNYPPFAAEKTANGNIYARGAQDMKCVGSGYLEGIRVLKANGKQPLRTIHAVFVPDEEIGGVDGMKLFVKTDLFKSLNLGFALDEGMASPNDTYRVFYGERCPWWVKVIAKGPPSHGSLFVKDGATEKLMKVIQKFMAYRTAEEQKLHIGRTESGQPLKVGDVTTINLTMLNAGIQFNIVPQEATAGFDIRVSPQVDLKAFHAMLEGWCTSEGCTMEFVNSFWCNAVSSTDESDPYWHALSTVFQARKITIEKEIFPAATDSRYIREVGIPAIGVSPIRNTPVLLHDHDEYLNEKTFMEGVSFYVDAIDALANIPAPPGLPNGSKKRKS